MTALPPVFAEWFARRGWSSRPHQLAAADAVRLVTGSGGEAAHVEVLVPEAEVP